MSESYTTGEIAKLCNVTVRTVQYYDTRGILMPSALSEGGRRLYSEDDLRKMKMICYLRSLGLSIDSIRKLLREENSKEVLRLLLEEHERELTDEINAGQERLEQIRELREALVPISDFSLESIGDIAYTMKNKKQRQRTLAVLLAAGILCEVIELATLLLWILKGIWLPYVCGLPVTIVISMWLMCFYYHRSVYICPSCHGVFRPLFWEFFFANHTTNTRKLTCTQCGRKGFCVETYGRKTDLKGDHDVKD